MKAIYFIRHFNGGGGLLKFEMIQCADDAEAMRKAVTEPPPDGCMSIEVARETSAVWRGSLEELGLSLH
jgi:hypothetical protein